MSDQDAYSLIVDDLTRIKEDELGHSPFSQGCIDGALDYIRDLRRDLVALSGDSTPTPKAVNDARLEMLDELLTAMYGSTGARAATPKQVWESALATIAQTCRYKPLSIDQHPALSGDTEPPKPGMAQCIFVWGDERCGLAPHHEGWHVGASLTWKGIHGPVYPLQGYLRAASSPEGTP